MPLAASTVVCLTFGLLASTPAPPLEAPRPSNGIVLLYKFKEGDVLRSRIEQSTTLDAVKGEYRETQETKTRTDQHFKVVSVEPDGSATLRLLIDGVRMEYAFNDGTPTIYDSSKDELPATAFAGVSQAIDRDLADLKIRPTGEIEQIQPLISEEELATIPGKLGLDPEEASNLLVIFPKQPLKVGDVWSNTYSTSVTVSGKLRQQVKILRQYRLDSYENGIATISIKTAPITAISEPSMLVQLLQRSSAGKMRFDVNAGRTIERTMHVDNTEIGWEGPDSSLHAVSEWTERAIAPPARLSSR